MSMEFKEGHSTESYGARNFGLKILVAIDRPFTENDKAAFYKAARELEEALLRESAALDPMEQEFKAKERADILSLFSEPIYVEELPNGYCDQWCCSQKPWYSVTTRKGVVTIGWRKRVINISWTPSVGDEAKKLFPEEDTTRFERTIHAYGYDKAREYLKVLVG